SHVLRFSLPRWVAYGVLGLEAALLAAVVRFSTDQAFLERRLGALRAHADGQHALIEAFERRLPLIRDEVEGWRALHLKMWKAFGARADSKRTASVPRAELPTTDLDVVASDVEAEGPRLRELERIVRRTSRMVSALPLRWPVRGPVTSGFGVRRSPWTGTPEEHHGIDIEGARGTPVTAPASGT